MWPFDSSSTPSPTPTPATTTTPRKILTNAEAINPLLNPLNPEGLKPCCACPDTKKLRDDCYLQFGSNVDEDSESSNKCKEIVENHLKCMRSLGFNV